MNLTYSPSCSRMLAAALAGVLWFQSGPAWSEPSPHRSLATSTSTSATAARTLPYAQAGLSSHEAAVYLLNRFAFGARPGEAQQLVSQGLEQWVEEQLRGDLPDSELESRLTAFPALTMEADKIRTTYIYYGQLLERASTVGLNRPENPSDEQQRDFNTEVRAFQLAHGILTIDDLFDEMRGAKLQRAVYGRNQLREVLSDFWFNHFNVAASDGNIRRFTIDYERVALRPHLLGSFPSMVAATARHPAMLYYLNNAQSSSAPTASTTLESRLNEMPEPDRKEWRQGQPGRRKNGGLNENYARELLELHTLGVDGGYTQKDVTETARAFSGWTVFPREVDNPNLRNLIEGKERLGYQRDGDFLFRADFHDADAKTILGRTFPAGRGLADGEEVLEMVALHPSTARFVSRKLAQRFVSDEPSEALVDKMAAEFSRSRGQIRDVLRVMVYSPEFWEGQRSPKVKSPFELVCSVLRACNAEVTPHRNQYDWIARLGEPLYSCIPPTGYSERSQVWLSPGMLVNRINFAQYVISNRVQGVRVELDKLCPAGPSRPQMLATLLGKLMPGAVESGQQLEKVREMLQEERDGYPSVPQWFAPKQPGDLKLRRDLAWRQRLAVAILGSPEFQRR